jgi:ribonuclease T2
MQTSVRHTLIALASLCAFASTAHAATENYLLAISWQPEFCESKPTKLECQTATPTRFDASHFTLHGLWPQSGSYCGVSKTNKSYDTSNRWNKLPAVSLNSSTRAELQQKMPGAQSYLERHEWIKHGTCSGLSQQTYFSDALSLLAGVNAGSLQSLVAANVGGSTTLDALYDAVTGDLGPDAETAVEFICDAGASGQMLAEIRFHLHLSNPMPSRILPQHLADPLNPASASQLCDGGEVFIDATGSSSMLNGARTIAPAATR